MVGFFRSAGNEFDLRLFLWPRRFGNRIRSAHGRFRRQSIRGRPDWAFPPRPAVRYVRCQRAEFDAVFDLGMVSANFPSIVQFSVSPTNNVFVGTLVTFTASVSGALPLYLQWRFNGGGGFANIPGDQHHTLTLDRVITNTGSYDFVLTNSYGAVTSAPITLTVTHDTTPPTVLSTTSSISRMWNCDFSKLLDAASATNLANYAFTNGLAILGRDARDQRRHGLLTTAPLVIAVNYTLVINGVHDQAIPPNTIATNTPVSFTASPWTSQDIGSPAIASTVTVTPPTE